MVKKKKLSRNAIIGYPAGIITGVTYGLNPLFGKPLMDNGASIDTILFYRYFFAVVLLGGFLLLTKQSFKVTAKQAGVLLVLGVLYTMSSTTLFEAYKYIASGLATTLVFLYPVLVAIIMVFLRVVPSWQVWLSIIATFIGVIIMTMGDAGQSAVDPMGVLLSIVSASVYALFIVIINRSKTISSISNSLLTFYALFTGVLIFLGKMLFHHTGMTEALRTWRRGATLWGWRCCQRWYRLPHWLWQPETLALRRPRCLACLSPSRRFWWAPSYLVKPSPPTLWWASSSR